MNMKILFTSEEARKIYSERTKPLAWAGEDSGMDLSYVGAEKCTIPAGGFAMIPTGVACQLSNDEGPNVEIQVRGRNGLASKGVFAHLGTVDFGYTGEIKVILFNLSGADFVFEPGDRIAQVVVMKVKKPEIEIVESLDETARGDNGFGSSGK